MLFGVWPESWRVFRIFFCTLLLICLTAVCADAFSFKKKKAQSTPETDISSSFPYRIFYTIEPSLSSFDNSKKWIDLNYKVVKDLDSRGPLFSNSPGGKVRFLDKEGFVIASDYFLNEEFQSTDFYGSVIVEKERAHEIVSADAITIGPDDLDLLRRQRLEKSEQKKKEDELFNIAHGKSMRESEISTSQARQVASQETAVLSLPSKGMNSNANLRTSSEDSPLQLRENKQASASKIALASQKSLPQAVPVGSNRHSPLDAGTPSVSHSNIEEKQVTAVFQQVKIPPGSQLKKKELLDIGGTTNEDVEETLSEIDKKPATEIKESPSKIPGFVVEDYKLDTSNAE